MDGQAIKEVERITQDGITVDINGANYSVHKMNRVFDDPRPKTVSVRTLTGFVDYLATKQCVDSWEDRDVVINVENHSRIIAFSKPFGELNSHSDIIVATLDRPEFEFGKWMDPESFNIALAAMFIETKDLDRVMAYAGKITIDTGVNVEDDGVTQRASVKKGITGGLTESIAAPSRVILKPYRTFDEVDQPESKFIFRVRVKGEASIECALFEADAGAWKNTAANSVKTWLISKETGIPVIA